VLREWLHSIGYKFYDAHVERDVVVKFICTEKLTIEIRAIAVHVILS
jgi:hypothetical protein